MCHYRVPKAYNSHALFARLPFLKKVKQTKRFQKEVISGNMSHTHTIKYKDNKGLIYNQIK